jgi:hypothetical protein
MQPRLSPATSNLPKRLLCTLGSVSARKSAAADKQCKKGRKLTESACILQRGWWRFIMHWVHSKDNIAPFLLHMPLIFLTTDAEFANTGMRALFKNDENSIFELCAETPLIRAAGLHNLAAREFK